MDEQRDLRAERKLCPDRLEDRFVLLAQGGARGIGPPDQLGPAQRFLLVVTGGRQEPGGDSDSGQ